MLCAPYIKRGVNLFLLAAVAVTGHNAGAAIPAMPQAQVKDAISRPLTNYADISGGAGTNSAYYGSAYVVMAAASFSGNSSSDARLLENLRYNISKGHDPSGSGGYVGQHELRFAIATALAKRTPRVWNKLTAAEKTKIDLVMKGLTVAAAYTSGVNNFEIRKSISPVRNLRAQAAWWRNAPNFKNAPPATMLAARVYFGSTGAVTAYLNSFNKSAFASSLKTQGLTNMYESYRLDGPNGPLGARPTATQVQDGVKDWRWAVTGDGLDRAQNILTDLVGFTFDKIVSPGVNNGAGIKVDGVMRARIMSGAAQLPNRGKIGMADELDAHDAEGIRSAMSYSMWGIRVALDAMTIAAAGGLIDVGSANVKNMRDRVQIGMTDFIYKSNKGYYSYAHGGTISNNEDWTPALRQKWAWDYTFGQWSSLIEPFLNGK